MSGKRKDSREAGKPKTKAAKDRAWFEWKVAELKAELDKLPADRQEQLRRELEDEPERGGRCLVCFRLRLMEAARMAVENQCEYFATTLTISPLKNATVINQIGEEIASQCGVAYLPTDFKKKNGYKLKLSPLFVLNFYS